MLKSFEYALVNFYDKMFYYVSLVSLCFKFISYASPASSFKFLCQIALKKSSYSSKYHVYCACVGKYFLNLGIISKIKF